MQKFQKFEIPVINTIRNHTGYDKLDADEIKQVELILWPKEQSDLELSENTNRS